MNCPQCNALMVDFAKPPYCPACETAAVVAAVPCSAPPWPCAGRNYLIKVNGCRSLNGVLYGVTVFGSVGECDPNTSPWNVLRALIDKAEHENPTMEHVQWASIELRLPNSV